MDKIPIILLAAGGSSRMGSPKQLLPWGEKTLIEHQIETLLNTQNPVIVVLGSEAEKIIPVIQNYRVTIVINSNWESGMGSSVSAGMKKLLVDFPSSSAVLFTLVDQPLISAAHLQSLIDTFYSKAPSIVASKSKEGWKGVPAVFDRFYFEQLKNLRGKSGAKSIISEHRKNVTFVEADLILNDMDDRKSYQKLLAEYAKNKA
jgi:molybdenum cofactor cytidylyltransferase